MQVFAVFSAVLALALAFVTPGVNSDEIPQTFRRMIANCLASEDTMACLSIKAIMALNRAVRTAKIEILPGVSIRRFECVFFIISVIDYVLKLLKTMVLINALVERRGIKIFTIIFILIRRDSARTAKAISENEIIDSLPADESERRGHLFNLAMDLLANFLDSHSLEVKLPAESTQFFARAIEERKKKKHHMGAIALALAIKALILAKLALLSKFCKGGGGKGHYTAGYVKVVGNEANAAQTELSPSPTFAEQYLYDRGYDSGQDLAYNAYYAH